jgi:hypothetical protein
MSSNGKGGYLNDTRIAQKAAGAAENNVVAIKTEAAMKAQKGGMVQLK